MFARVAERKMLSVRAILLLGWLVLIASLVWDPFSERLTRPENLASPFRIGKALILVQGRAVSVAPYPLGNRVFWTMIVPVLPLFLMVFGHEAWRRVCPLSFASQLPRYLGWRRRRPVLQRRTGRIERVPALVARDSWLQRNAWYVQIGVLYTGLCTRILFINSDRFALASALLGVIVSAITVGYLWGGKTWCNFICPANIVQRIHPPPRGPPARAPHVGGTAVPQSMCRTAGPGPDKSACVACAANCGDIDLERSYWESLEAPYRRHVYYMFFGLIVGFYGYYYLYAGSWDYYFSGVWTHERGQLAQLLRPGLFVGGHAVPVPKVLAVPAFLLLSAGGSLLLGKLLEGGYRKYRRARGRVSEPEIVHHCLCFSAYLSINTFYVFGGRPNLLLLPQYGIRAVDLLIVSLTTVWLWQALQRTPLRYRRESLASSLIEQLRKLKVNVGKYFEGRSLEELKPDEVYVLAKVLPDVSHEQRLAAYRNILDDAISTGKTNSAQFLDTLAELRTGMGVTEAEHTQLLEQLGVSMEVDLDARRATTEEKALCIANYTEMVGAAIAGQVELGHTLAAILASADMRRTVSIMRASFQVSDEEHEAVLAGISGDGGILVARLDALMDQMRALLAARFCVLSSGADDEFWSALARLVVGLADQRCDRLYVQLFSIIHALGTSPAAGRYAAGLANMSGRTIDPVLSRLHVPNSQTTWREQLDEGLVAVLSGATPSRGGTRDGRQAASISPRQHSYRDIIKLGLDKAASLEVLMQHGDPVAQALTLTAFSYVDPELARDRAGHLAQTPGPEAHWLLAEVLDRLRAPKTVRAVAAGHQDDVRVTVLRDGEAVESSLFDAAHIAIGRAPGNEVTINDRLVAPYHAVLHRNGYELSLARHDDAPIFVDGAPCTGDAAPVRSGVVISFTPMEREGPSVRVEWQLPDMHYSVQHCDTVTKLVWLSRSPMLQTLDLAVLARLARDAEVRRYRSGTLICPEADEAGVVFMQTGAAAISEPSAAPGSTRDMLLAGEIFLTSAASGTPGEAVPAAGTCVQVTSDFAVVVLGDHPDQTASLIQHLRLAGLRAGPGEAARHRLDAQLIPS